ncbi:MAG: hypothetical protein WBB60_01470 [Nitrospira sp.]
MIEMTYETTRVSLVVVLLLAMGGCLPSLEVAPRAQADALVSRCPLPRPLQAAIPPAKVHSELVAAASSPEVMTLTSTAVRFSPDAQRTAAQIGILELLSTLQSLEPDQRGDELVLPLLSARQEISRRIAIAVSDVRRLMAAIDCEASRSDHVAYAIGEAHQSVSEKALFAVFASDIFIGIIPGALLLAGHDIAAEANEVFGGVIATGFGSVDAIVHIDQEFRHPDNFLWELWDGPSDPQLFPLSVWRYLNSPSEEDATRTVRDALKQRWETEGRWGGKSGEESHLHTLLIGAGGPYGEKELRLRAEMLTQLRAEVLQFGQNLHRLKYEAVSWLDQLTLNSGTIGKT